MNNSQDIFQTFFTLQKPRVKTDSDEDDASGNGNAYEARTVARDEATTTEIEITTTESSYTIYAPSGNYFVGWYIMFIVVASIVANLWVITVMCLRKRKFKSTHVFIVALAVSDILFSLSIHPMLIATSFGVDPHRLFGKTGCDWYGFGAVFFGSLSMCIHGTVGFTRYKIIVCSNDHVWHKMSHNLAFLVFNIAISFFVAIAPVLGWGRYETFEFGCTVAFHDPSFNVRSYVAFTMTTVMLIPLGSCIWYYGKIIWFSYYVKLELFTMNESSENDLTEMQIDPLNPTGGAENSESKCDVVIRNVDPSLLKAISLADKKLTRLTLVAAMGFMVAWMPFCILCFWEAATPPTDIPTTFRVIACLFCKSATAYNPFIYFFMGKEFREDCCFLFAQVVDKLTCCKRSGDMRLGFYSEPSSVAPVQANNRRNLNRQDRSPSSSNGGIFPTKKPSHHRRVAAKVISNGRNGRTDIKVNPMEGVHGMVGQKARVKSMSSEEVAESRLCAVETFELTPRKFPSSPIVKSTPSPSTSCNNLSKAC